jgi:hypothetical protein
MNMVRVMVSAFMILAFFAGFPAGEDVEMMMMDGIGRELSDVVMEAFIEDESVLDSIFRVVLAKFSMFFASIIRLVDLVVLVSVVYGMFVLIGSVDGDGGCDGDEDEDGDLEKMAPEIVVSEEVEGVQLIAEFLDEFFESDCNSLTSSMCRQVVEALGLHEDSDGEDSLDGEYLSSGHPEQEQVIMPGNEVDGEFEDQVGAGNFLDEFIGEYFGSDIDSSNSSIYRRIAKDFDLFSDDGSVEIIDAQVETSGTIWANNCASLEIYRRSNGIITNIPYTYHSSFPAFIDRLKRIQVE